MAEVNFTLTATEGRTYRVVWADVTEADTCTPISIPGGRDRTVQVKGTFGGTTVTIRGSLDADGGGTYADLSDPSGTALSFTAAGIDAISENTFWTKPAVLGGTSVSVTITILYGSVI